MREYMAGFTQECIDGILAIARDPTNEPKDRLTGYRWVAEHVIGKAVQPVSGPEGAPLFAFDLSKLTADDLAALEQMRKRLTG